MKTKALIVLGILMITLYGCESSGEDTTGGNGSGGGSNNGGGTNSVWTIPVGEVFDGGPGVDGIPAIENPRFIAANSSTANSYLTNDDLVVGIVVGNEARAYPHAVLNWHEIVNDDFNGQKITINYCPLTGSAMGWKGVAGGVETSFGVSGLLYNSNLILYDRISGSRWSQMKLECVNGPRLRDVPETVEVVETTWGTWKAMFPQSQVLNNVQEGVSRDYSIYPYGVYLVVDDLFLFPVSPVNDQRPFKERVHAIIESGSSKVYTFDSFSGGNVIKDQFKGKNILVVGNDDVIKSFIIPNSLSSLTFSYDYNNSEAFFTDDEQNSWNLFGEAISGPRAGQRLQQSTSMMSFWFAIAAFYPNPEVYQ